VLAGYAAAIVWTTAVMIADHLWLRTPTSKTIESA
jgi:hypothetical protein